MNPYETASGESPAQPLQNGELTADVSHTELLQQFNQEGDQLTLLLEKMNKAFEEKLAILATKQLLAKLSSPVS